MFENAKLTGVKADLATSEIKITIIVALNEDNMAEASLLAEHYVGTTSDKVKVTIEPYQPRLPG